MSVSPPPRLQAGDTLAWCSDLPAYPADQGWVLSHRLTNAAGLIDISSSADTDQPARHRVSIDAATSAAYKAGTYVAISYVTRGAERKTIARAEVRVLPDLAAGAAPIDARSDARRALDDLRAALRSWLRSSGTVSEYQIAGRRMKVADADEIRKRIRLAEAELAREDAADRLAAGLGTRRRVLVRFQ